MDSAVAELRQEGFQVQIVDVNAQPSLAWKYQIRQVPTYVYVRGGKEIRRRTGVLPKTTLRQMYRRPWGHSQIGPPAVDLLKSSVPQMTLWTGILLPHVP
jgi:thioredoxin-like negative regulator of GroEL